MDIGAPLGGEPSRGRGCSRIRFIGLTARGEQGVTVMQRPHFVRAQFAKSVSSHTEERG